MPIVTAVGERASYGVEATSSAAAPSSPISIADVVAALLRKWRWLVFLPLAIGVLTAGVLLLLPNRYTATTTIVPETRSSTATMGQLAGLAALAGVNVGGAAMTQSPQFYVALLGTKSLRYTLLERRFSTTGSPPSVVRGDSAKLIDLLDVNAPTAGRRLWKASEVLDRATQVTLDVKTGIIRVSFTNRSPALAAAVANAYAEELNRFNRETRQSSARLRRQFVETRLDEVGRELRNAEDAARFFLTANRQYQTSPSLTFEYQRLQRTLTQEQDLFGDLRRQLDAARIAEVDDTPSLTILESAIVPQEKSWPHRTGWLLVVLIVTFVVTGAVILIVEKRERLLPGLHDTMDVFRQRAAARRQTRAAAQVGASPER